MLHYGEAEFRDGKVVRKRPVILKGEKENGIYIFHLGDREHTHGYERAKKKIIRLNPENFNKALGLFEKIHRPEDNYSFEEVVKISAVEDLKTLLRYTREFDSRFFNHPDWRIRMVIAVNNSKYFNSLKDDFDYRILTEIISKTNEFNEYFIEKIKIYSADEDVQGVKPAYMHPWVRAEIYKKDPRFRRFLKEKFSWDTMLEKGL